MRCLSFVIFFLIMVSISGQSPHGQNFEIDCTQCHNTEGWAVNQNEIEFDHSGTGFELIGQHGSIDCRSCHTSLVFENVKQNCFECHTDIHENTLGKECSECHSPSSWIVSNITEIHQVRRFPLIGSHAIADCAECHSSASNQRYNVLGVDCFSCHSDDYNSTQNPNHSAAGFSTDCEECHSLNSNEWGLKNFAHEFFPLAGVHDISNCFDCHQQNTFTGLSQECSFCHQSDYNSSANPSHQNLSLPTDCLQCHNTVSPGWQPAQFPIHDQFFQLIGAHSQIGNDCAQCHNGNYNTQLPNECFGCHETNYNSVQNPPHASLNFSTDCTECHNQTAWIPSTFDHDGQYFPIYSGKHNGEWNNCSDCHTVASNYAVFECITCHEHNQQDMDSEHQGINGYIYQSSACFDCHPTGEKTGSINHNLTNFPLTGSHVGIECSSCHTSGYVGTSTLCVDCHRDDLNTAPNHIEQSFPTDCESCHSTSDWAQTTFDHNQTNFSLTGAHIGEDCGSCHTNGVFQGTSAICVDCHLTDFQNSINPNHQSLGLSNECQTCHTTEPNWNPAEFPIHNDFYTLIGAHSSISNQCIDCHNNDYVNTPNMCFGCHESDYNLTNNPPHQSAGFSQDCETCHTQTAWLPSTFDHDGQYFPVYSGEHNGEWNDCSDCHTIASNYAVFECITCHEHNQQDMDDKHQGVQGYIYISTECFACHPDGTAEGAFNHNTSQFPLLGAHTTANCSDCHQTGYLNTPLECYSCHENSFANAQNPNHVSLGLSNDCSTCHNSDAWIPGSFDHQNTGFELLGQHTQTQCADCHSNGIVNTPNQCYDCHETNFVLAPDHQSAGYPTDCEMCHNSTAWNQAAFDHSQTNFPLTGAHVSTNCSECHSTGFTGTTSMCFDCHTEDFQNSTNPNHQSLGLSNQCDECHSTESGWNPANFPNHNSYFALIGAHAQISNDCQSCHNGNYNNTPIECFGCHEQDFNLTNNPDHAAAGFPQECESCHSESAWIPSTFDHDGQYFPIFSGRHQGEWNNCIECHTIPSNFSVFSCIDCHEHNQQDMDDEHQGVQNYAYNSIACFDCHPDGNEKSFLNRDFMKEK